MDNTTEAQKFIEQTGYAYQDATKPGYVISTPGVGPGYQEVSVTPEAYAQAQQQFTPALNPNIQGTTLPGSTTFDVTPLYQSTQNQSFSLPALNEYSALQALPKITIDEQNMKLKISAPQDFYDSEVFKNQWADSLKFDAKVIQNKDGSISVDHPVINNYESSIAEYYKTDVPKLMYRDALVSDISNVTGLPVQEAATLVNKFKPAINLKDNGVPFLDETVMLDNGDGTQTNLKDVLGSAFDKDAVDRSPQLARLEASVLDKSIAPDLRAQNLILSRAMRDNGSYYDASALDIAQTATYQFGNRVTNFLDESYVGKPVAKLLDWLGGTEDERFGLRGSEQEGITSLGRARRVGDTAYEVTKVYATGQLASGISAAMLSKAKALPSFTSLLESSPRIAAKLPVILENIIQDNLIYGANSVADGQNNSGYFDKENILASLAFSYLGKAGDEISAGATRETITDATKNIFSKDANELIKQQTIASTGGGVFSQLDKALAPVIQDLKAAFSETRLGQKVSDYAVSASDMEDYTTKKILQAQRAGDISPEAFALNQTLRDSGPTTIRALYNEFKQGDTFGQMADAIVTARKSLADTGVKFEKATQDITNNLIAREDLAIHNRKLKKLLDDEKSFTTTGALTKSASAQQASIKKIIANRTRDINSSSVQNGVGELIHQKVIQGYRDLLDYRLATKDITREQYDNYLKDGLDYTAIRRILTDDERAIQKAKGIGDTRGKLDRKLKVDATTRDIEDPIATLDSFARKTFDSVVNRYRQDVQLQLLKEGDSVQKLAEGADVTGKLVITARDGSVYEITDPKLYEGLKQIPPEELGKVTNIARSINKARNIFTTGAEVVFALTKNLFKDVSSQTVKTENIADILSPRALVGRYKIGEREQRIFMNGATSYNQFDKVDDVARGVKDILKGRSNSLDNGSTLIRNPKDIPKFILEQLDKGAAWVPNVIERGGRYSSFRASENLSLKRGADAGFAAIKAIADAERDLTNFNQLGRRSAQLNAWVRYFNAAQRGAASLNQTFTMRPATTSVRLAMLMYPLIWLATNQMDDEKTFEVWQDLSDYQRYGFMNYISPDAKKNPVTGRWEGVYSLPLGEDVAPLYGTFISGLEAVRGTQNWSNVAKPLLEWVTPLSATQREDGVSGLFKQNLAQVTGSELISATTGEDLRTGQIIKSGDLNVESGVGDLQSKSGALSWVADKLGIDGATTNYLYQQAGSTMGQYLINGIDQMLGRTDPVTGDKLVGGYSPIQKFVRNLSQPTNQAQFEWTKTVNAIDKFLTYDLKKADSALQAQISASPEKETELMDQRNATVNLAMRAAEEKVKEYTDKYGQLDDSQAKRLFKIREQTPNPSKDPYIDSLKTTLFFAERERAVNATDTLGAQTPSDIQLQTSFGKGIGASNRTKFNVEQSIKNAKLSDLKYKLNETTGPLYDKAANLKGTAKDEVFKQIEQLQKQYMDTVVGVLQQIKQDNGVASLDNKAIIDLLDNYVVVPSDYTIEGYTKKGKPIYASSKAEFFSKQDAFRTNYLKSLIGIGGGDYTGIATDAEVTQAIEKARQQLDNGQKASAKATVKALEAKLVSDNLYADQNAVDNIKALQDMLK